MLSVKAALIWHQTLGRRLKTINVTDRRRRKDKQPVMLKRFRNYTEAMSSRQDSDIADRKGSQPAAYHKGLKKIY